MWQVLKRLWLKNCARVKPQNSSKLFLLAPFWAPKLCQMFWKKTCHTQKNVVFFHVFQGIMVHFVRKYDVTKAGNSTFNFVQDTLLQVPSSCGDNQDGCQDSVVGWSKIGWELMQRVDVFCCCCQHETCLLCFRNLFFWRMFLRGFLINKARFVCWDFQTWVFPGFCLVASMDHWISLVHSFVYLQHLTSEKQ